MNTSEDKKISRSQTLQHKSYQIDKHLGCPPWKIFWTILKMDKEGTQTNWPKDKQIDDDAQGVTFERWYRLYVSIKGGRRLASIENCIDASL